MKVIALVAAILFAAVGITAVGTQAAAVHAPVYQPAQSLIVQVKRCPQPTYDLCVDVCHTKYKGKRCSAWCRERCR